MIDIKTRYTDRFVKRLGLDVKSYKLMEAVEHGFMIEAKYLINDGADVNAINTRTKECPLEIASEKGNTEMVHLLLTNGAHIELKGSFESPLELAITNGHTDTVTLLIKLGAKINIIESHNDTALQLASENGHNEIVKLLIQSGADVNYYVFEPALVSAVKNGHIDVVKTLIDGGAMIDYQDINKCSVLETALVWDDKDIANILIEHGANIDGALDKAFETKSIEMVELLLNKEIDVKYKDKYGKTLLMIAAKHGELQLMSDLIDKGTDIEEKDNYGMTALMMASMVCCFKAVEMLIEKGAKVNEKSNDGLTALMYASSSNLQSKEIVRKLIESGSCVNERSKDGSTALIFAVLHKHIDILTVLIDNGADLNIKRNDGDTAVIFATAHEQIKTLEMLIDGGADVNVFGKEGLSPRQIAVCSKRLKSELLKSLEKKPSMSKHILPESLCQGVRSYLTPTCPDKNDSEDKIGITQLADPLQMLNALPLDTEEQRKLDENDMEILSEKLQALAQLSQDEIFLSETPRNFSNQLKKRKRTKRRVHKNASKPLAVTNYGSKVKFPKVSSRQGLKVRAAVMLEECVANVTTKRSTEFTSEVSPIAHMDDKRSHCFSSKMDNVLLKHKRNLSANKQITDTTEHRKNARKNYDGQQSQRVYVFYFINNVKNANLMNASYVNLMKTRNCVIK